MKSKVTHALTIDLEDWFCSTNMEKIVPYKIWDKQVLRIENSTKKILDILSKKKTLATFFVLGWVAEKIPHIITEISRKGHEISSHGFNHKRLFDLSLEDFEYDIKKSIDIIEDITSKPVVGYRAPSFSLISNKEQIFEILMQNNIIYDSSILPSSYHPDYGYLPPSPTTPYWLKHGHLLEVPVTVTSLLGFNVPMGGGYFRLLPYFYTQYSLRKLTLQNQSAIFYFHPWEIDVHQPRMKIPYTKRFRHYYGLKTAEEKLNRLIDEFSFAPIKDVILPTFFQNNDKSHDKKH